MYLKVKFCGDHRSGDINLTLVLTWISWKKQKSLPQSVKLRDFQNQEYQYTILKKFKQQEKKKIAIAKHYTLQANAIKNHKHFYMYDFLIAPGDLV